MHLPYPEEAIKHLFFPSKMYVHYYFEWARIQLIRSDLLVLNPILSLVVRSDLSSSSRDERVSRNVKLHISLGVVFTCRASDNFFCMHLRRGAVAVVNWARMLNSVGVRYGEFTTDQTPIYVSHNAHRPWLGET